MRSVCIDSNNKKIKYKKLTTSIIIILVIFLSLIPVGLGAETVSKDNYAEPVIKVNNKTYIVNESVVVLKPGERVIIVYEILPKTDDDAKIIDGRYYWIYTNLQDPKVKIEITYKNGAREYESGLDLYVRDAEALGGIRSILINLTGTTPFIAERAIMTPIMWIKVQDSKDDPLPPVTVIVVNTSKFVEDMRILRNKLKKLESEAAKFEDVYNYIKLASENMTLAESYYKDGKYIEADKCLDHVENNLIKAEFELKKAKAMYKYEELKKNLDKLRNLIIKTENLISSAKEKGKNVTIYELKLSEIKVRYEDLIRNINKIEEYLNEEKFSEAMELSNHTLESVNLMIFNLTNTTQELEKLMAENKIRTFNIFNNNYIIIGGFIMGGLIVLLVVEKLRRKRKWDELK